VGESDPRDVDAVHLGPGAVVGEEIVGGPTRPAIVQDPEELFELLWLGRMAAGVQASTTVALHVWSEELGILAGCQLYRPTPNRENEVRARNLSCNTARRK